MHDMNGHTSQTPTRFFFGIPVDGMCCFVTFALGLVLRIFRLELSLGSFRLETFAWQVSLRIFSNLGGGPFPEAQDARIDEP